MPSSLIWSGANGAAAAHEDGQRPQRLVAVLERHGEDGVFAGLAGERAPLALRVVRVGPPDQVNRLAGARRLLRHQVAGAAAAALRFPFGQRPLPPGRPLPPQAGTVRGALVQRQGAGLALHDQSHLVRQGVHNLGQFQLGGRRFADGPEGVEFVRPLPHLPVQAGVGAGDHRQRRQVGQGVRQARVIERAGNAAGQGEVAGDGVAGQQGQDEGGRRDGQAGGTAVQDQGAGGVQVMWGL